MPKINLLYFRFLQKILPYGFVTPDNEPESDCVRILVCLKLKPSLAFEACESGQVHSRPRSVTA